MAKAKEKESLPQRAQKLLGLSRKNLIFLVCSALIFVILMSLGFWQLSRRAWKENLVRQAEIARTAAPLRFGQFASATWRREGAASEYHRVRMRGLFKHEKEFHVYAPYGGGVGWSVITPFVSDDGPVVLVIRGVVPDAQKDPAKRPQAQGTGFTTITGRVRLAEKATWFTPNPDTGKNTWYHRDIDLMTSQVEAMAEGPSYTRRGIVEFYVEQEGDPAPGGFPRPELAPISIKNDHLGYALTWFGLALVWLVMTCLYVWRLKA